MPKAKHEEVVKQLDLFYAQTKRQILQNQSAITGLFPADSLENSSASIKTSLWAASSIFALYLAYSKRVDNDKGKAHDLGQSVVKCMRGILFAWMRQSEKVESFKANQSPKHALHLKFDLHSGLANDSDYPHLQIDVVSLYLIFLANFIASGLDIIYCMDEVTFIQNLVYYVERAYRTPDYGSWEPKATPRGNQTDKDNQKVNTSNYQQVFSGPAPAHSITPTARNQQEHFPKTLNHHHHHHYHHHLHNSPTNTTELDQKPDGRSLEIHATSIGMAKSALEAINGCNLFGGKGANWSIIYSDIDAHSRNRSIFETLLPRESRSKNTDSYLLATISWPCFATHDPTLYGLTKSKVIRKLKGKYGFKRFLRDPYGTDLVKDMVEVSKASSLMSLDNLQTHSSSCTHSQTTGSRGDNFRELSFGSTTSESSVSLNEPPKIKQRKSSYFQRKNVTSFNSYQFDEANRLNSQSSSSPTRMSKRYEHIESEWPLFVCFLIIDGIFKQDFVQISENEKLLYEKLLMMDAKHGDYLMPKYYYVPKDLINSEKCCPDSVVRLPSAEGSSPDQLYLTGQSILLITRLLLAGLVHPNELDPLRRHMPSHDRPKTIGRYSSFQATSADLVVQTVLIAESIRLQAMMANYGIQTQTPLEVEPVQIWSSAQLVKVYEYLGVNEKLGLKGRPSRPIGALGTSKLYRICGQTILCYPLIFEVSDFYLAQDMLLLIDDIQNELNFIGRYWRMSGRPTVCILIREEHLRDVHFRDLLDLLVQFKNGQLKKSGLRIKTGRLQNLIRTSCIEHLDFLHLLPHEHLPQFQSFKQLVESPKRSLLSQKNKEVSYTRVQQPRIKRSHLNPLGSHNLQAIEEHNNSAIEKTGNMSQAPDNHLDFNVTADSGHKMNPFNLEDSYSTWPCTAIDYYECYKAAPTWPTIIEMLRSCRELGGQSQLLAVLWQREGPKYMVDNVSVDQRMESVSQAACQSRNWSVVRYCSAILERSVESLSPWLTSILVNGKQISFGTGSNEKIINNPLTPVEIHTLIYSTISTRNPCDAVLQQEIALYIGRLISTRPEDFEGILTIRVTNFMSAIRSYLNIKTQELKLRLITAQEVGLSRDAQYQQQQQQQSQHQEELLDLRIKTEPKPTSSSVDMSTSMSSLIEEVAVQTGDRHGETPPPNNRKHRPSLKNLHTLMARPLESLSPSQVRSLLVKVLSEDESMTISDRRQITGELCRVPKDFYDKVWALLSCTNIGIVIGGKILRSMPILTNMTQDDLNFALKVESLVSSIDCPKLRQLNVELLMALHVILERNPEIRFDSDPLDLSKIISLSLEKFRGDFSREDYGLKEYYEQTVQTTMLYTIRTVFDCLLPVKCKTTQAEDGLSCPDSCRL